MGIDNKTIIVLMKVNVFTKCSFLKVMHILMVICSDKVMGVISMSGPNC